MLIREAMSVFWQSLRDTWEELLSLALVNLTWLASWVLPLYLFTVAPASPFSYVLLIPGAILASISAAGIYHVTRRVAHGKTFHYADFVEGMRLLWWRAVLWLLANVLVVWLVWVNLWFYSGRLEGVWALLVSGFWLAAVAFWLAMQLYFWPMLLQLDTPRMLLAWKNSALLIAINPFYAFFVVSFTLLVAAISVAVVFVLVVAGMAIIALLGHNAVLTLLTKLGKIEDPRPKLPVT